MDDGSLLKVLNNARSVNSQLMKTNLGLLMSIRETDCEIQRAKEQLQKYHAMLQERGISIGAACDNNATTKAPDSATKEHTNANRGNEASANDEDNDDDDDQNTDSSSDSSADE